MHDLISRQALCEYALNQKDKSVTPNDIMRFPSAQPDVPDINDGDMISRKAAMLAITERMGEVKSPHGSGEMFWEGLCIARSIVGDLPSAQPDFSCDGCKTPKHICGICMRNYPNITDHYCTGEWEERRKE